MPSHLSQYLDLLSSRGNVKLADSVKKTASDIGDKYIRNFSFTSHEIGLLFGNVQSGKTGQMFGVMCKAADLGFSAFLLLTTDNVVLQQQTLDRVKADLSGFCICGENDQALFNQNALALPAIVVLKKNSRILRLWANIFSATGFMRGNPLFIVDDEADAASLNTLVNKNKQSTINKHLDTIKNGASSSIYLQVTGTPQALYLQTMKSGWQPLFTYYFKPGDGYLGGDFFFPTGRKADCISYLDDLETPARAAVVHHLAVSGQVAVSGGTVSNCLVHPSVRQAQHDAFADEFAKELKWCSDNLNGEFKDLLVAEYNSLHPEKAEKASFDDVFSEISGLLRHSAIRIFIMNGKNDIKSEYYSSGFNIIIGGNTLGRGVTFPGLHTIYYSRSSKKPQADTMWQHSRMFGYDRDPGLMRVYIDERLYKLFSDINATNNSLIAQVEDGIQNIKIVYSEGLNPTRKAVIDNKHVTTLSGGTNYFPYDADNDSIEELDQLLSPFESDVPSYQVSLQLIKRIMQHIVSGPDFCVESFIGFIDTQLAQNPGTQARLIVRRDRDITKGARALLSPNDWDLGMSMNSTVVLTMYKMLGNKGWNGRKVWVPNIKLPTGIVYYDVDDEELDDIDG